MKHFLLVISLLFISVLLHGEPRDLSYYLEMAQANSPLINKALNENKIADLDLKQIQSILFKPELNLEANVLLAPIISHDNNQSRFEIASKGADNYTGYDLAVTNGGQYQAMMSLKQPLLTGSIYESYSNKAEITRRINENTIELTKHELEQLVSYQYILCMKSKKQSEISFNLLEELKNQLQILEKLVDNAIYKQTDLMLLLIEYDNYEVEYKTYLADLKNNIYDLNLICGINDSNGVNLQDIEFKLKMPPSDHSKFLTSYKNDSLNIIVEQTISEQKYKPQLYFFTNAGLNAAYLPTVNRFGFSVGFNFSYNLYDGNQRQIHHEISVVNLQNIEFEKRNFIIQNEINKNKYLNIINSIDERIQMIEGQLVKYDKLHNVYELELSQGDISVMDFKNLMKDIAGKKQESLLLKMEKLTLINSYNYWNF